MTEQRELVPSTREERERGEKKGKLDAGTHLTQLLDQRARELRKLIINESNLIRGLLDLALSRNEITTRFSFFFFNTSSRPCSSGQSSEKLISSYSVIFKINHLCVAADYDERKCFSFCNVMYFCVCVI